MSVLTEAMSVWPHVLVLVNPFLLWVDWVPQIQIIVQSQVAKVDKLATVLKAPVWSKFPSLLQLWSLPTWVSQDRRFIFCHSCAFVGLTDLEFIPELHALPPKFYTPTYLLSIPDLRDA